VGTQVLGALTGAGAVTMSGRGILVAKELTPAQAAELNGDLVQGIVLAYGSPSSHAAILARSRGIPALVAAGPEVLTLAEGTTIVIDGATGELLVDPSETVLARFPNLAAELAAKASKHRAEAGEPAYTVDGTRIEVAANLGSRSDARAAGDDGADSAGLVRTEFLFLDRDEVPDLQEQVEEYLAIADAMGGRRVTFRTLDIGGFPMVTTIGELRAARLVLEEAAGPAGLPQELRVGMMVEVPAAALKIATFLPPSTSSASEQTT
jgi:multiphosphoryl transfer protein